MILLITLSIQEEDNEKSFKFKGATGNIQGNKYEMNVRYSDIADLFTRIGWDVRDVVLKEQTDRIENIDNRT